MRDVVTSLQNAASAWFQVKKKRPLGWLQNLEKKVV